MECKKRLEKYLRDNGVQFQAMTHRTAFTAQEMAAAQGVKGQLVAKVTMVKADGKLAMLVLPASYRVDLAKVKEVLGVQEVRLALEPEFEGRFPDCDTGAMPPFGNLYDVPVFVDRALTQDPEIVFQAGTHRDTMKIAYKDYARLARPITVDFAIHR